MNIWDQKIPAPAAPSDWTSPIHKAARVQAGHLSGSTCPTVRLRKLSEQYRFLHSSNARAPILPPPPQKNPRKKKNIDYDIAKYGVFWIVRHGRRCAPPRCVTALLRLLRSRSVAAASIDRCSALLPPSFATSRSGPPLLHAVSNF